MSLHTGIEPGKEIDVLELNLPTKKYVDDKLTLKVDKAGDTITGPLSMDDGKIWDLSSGTLDTNAVNKKYVDDAVNLKLSKTGGTLSGELSMDDSKITDLATPTADTDAANKKYVDDNASSDIVVKDASYTTGYVPMKVVNISGKRLNTDLTNLVGSTIKHPKIFTLRVSFNNSLLALAFSNGKSALIFGGFDSLSGSVLKASLFVGSQANPFTKVKLMYSNQTSIISTTGDISDEISGSFGKGSHNIPVSGQKFTDLRYLVLYFEASTSLSLLNISLDVVFIIN